MDFDCDILFEFLSEDHKNHFLVWDNSYRVPNTNSDKKGYIVAVYRAPFQEKILLSVSDYENRLKQKRRENKLNKTL